MTGLLFRLFGKAIHRHIAEGSLRPAGFDGMQHAYSGTDGRAYYTWADIADMPPVRQKHIERCLKMADAGIGEKTLEALCDIASEAIMSTLQEQKPAARSKAAARAAHAIGEIRNRPKEVIPEEVYYDLAAVFVVREDEDPRGFDPGIHTQKIEMLSKAGRAGYTFFTSPPAWRKVLGSSLTTESAYIELLSSWTAQRLRLTAVLQASGKSPSNK